MRLHVVVGWRGTQEQHGGDCRGAGCERSAAGAEVELGNWKHCRWD